MCTTLLLIVICINGVRTKLSELLNMFRICNSNCEFGILNGSKKNVCGSVQPQMAIL